uniref:(California timema) hypothetical protein n=1 Tax=Timema californicum TaxID=61474 RepID=A0A7R9JKA9_TIMCA|nr:unnamed protein product [Timema californicum]
MKRLLRHVFRHRHFEVTLSYNMEWVVAGHRGKFSLPGDHEDACLNLLSCCLDGRIQTMAEVLNTADINPDVTDARGNSGLLYAAVSISGVGNLEDRKPENKEKGRRPRTRWMDRELKEMFVKIDRNERGCTGRPTEVETLDDDDDE